MDGKFKWVESLPQKTVSAASVDEPVDEPVDESAASVNEPVNESSASVNEPVDESSASVDEPKAVSFADKLKMKPRPPPPAHKPPVLPSEEVDSEFHTIVDGKLIPPLDAPATWDELFPGLPEMSPDQKAKREAEKKAYLAMVAKDIEIQRLKDELAKAQSTTVVSESPEEKVDTPVLEEIPVLEQNGIEDGGRPAGCKRATRGARQTT